MEFSEKDIAIVALCGGAISTVITLMWKFFGITKQVDMKAEKGDIYMIHNELTEMRHKYDILEAQLRDKASSSDVELLKKDISYIKDQMISKSDLLNLRNDILNAIIREKDE